MVAVTVGEEDDDDDGEADQKASFVASVISMNDQVRFSAPLYNCFIQVRIEIIEIFCVSRNLLFKF